MDRRLTITVLTQRGEFLVETEYRNGHGYWVNLSRTVTTKFPSIIVDRVANRADYQIFVRVR